MTYLGQSCANENIGWIVIMKNLYKTTNETTNLRVGGRAITQPLALQMTWILYEFCYVYWKVTKSLSVDPLWNNYIPRDIWIFRYKHKRQRLVCILRKYKCLVGYFMVYHSKATDGARLAEMIRLPRMFIYTRGGKSPNPPIVKMRLCKHGKSALLLL